MAEYMMLMHNDVEDRKDSPDWGTYLATLRSEGALQGGSAIGPGACMRRNGPVPGATNHLVGYVKIAARNLDHARKLVAGNPIYEAGGTVEIRELPRTD